MDHKYLLVNRESVSPEAFSGDGALFPLNHYPTILCKIGTMGKEAQSLQNANEILNDAPDEPAPDAEPATSSSSDDVDATPEPTTQEKVENMLDSLF